MFPVVLKVNPLQHGLRCNSILSLLVDSFVVDLIEAFGLDPADDNFVRAIGFSVQPAKCL